MKVEQTKARINPSLFLFRRVAHPDYALAHAGLADDWIEKTCDERTPRVIGFKLAPDWTRTAITRGSAVCFGASDVPGPDPYFFPRSATRDQFRMFVSA